MYSDVRGPLIASTAEDIDSQVLCLGELWDRHGTDYTKMDGFPVCESMLVCLCPYSVLCISGKTCSNSQPIYGDSSLQGNSICFVSDLCIFVVNFRFLL